MRQLWRILRLNKKLLMFIVLVPYVFWAVYGVAWYLRLQCGDQHLQQDSQNVVSTPVEPKQYDAPNWTSVQRGVEINGKMLNSDRYIGLLHSKSSHSGDYFDPRINATAHTEMTKLLWQVDEFCRQNDLIYFMYAATLLGSHRHHGLVPWDDDVDFMIPLSQRYHLLYLMRTRSTDLRVFTWSTHWKVWSLSTSVKIINRNYGWPFLDLFFYGENDTHIYDSDPYNTGYVYEKSIVFPLHYRPFMGRWLPAPRDSSKFLVSTVKDPDGCHSPYYLHDVEKAPAKAVGIRCEMLKDRFPFVLKSLPPEGSGDGIQESLYLGNVQMHSVIVQEPNTSLTYNYSLRLINSDGVRYADPFA